MATAKETVRVLLDDLPEDASCEDIQYGIFVRQRVERGLKVAEEGRVVSHEEAMKRIARWLQR